MAVSLSPPKFLEMMLMRVTEPSEQEPLLGDFEEMYKRIASQKGKARALIQYFFYVLKLVPKWFFDMVYWRSRMFRNDLKMAWRNTSRHKGYSLITITGLAVGLACCVLMMLWIYDELSFDRFHKNGDSIYRLITETKTEIGVTLDARAPTPTGPAVQSEIPEILEFCRYRKNQSYGISYGENTFFDDIIGIADPNFFQLFTFPFVKGDPGTALEEPYSMVISETLARKLFGGEDPMGKILIVGGIQDEFKVTGIIQDVPENSHLHFDCMIPIVIMSRYHHVDFENWNSMFFYCYVRMAKQSSIPEATTKVSELVSMRLGKPNVSVQLQPLKDVHLKSNFNFDLDNYGQGNASTLTIFTLAAIVILLLACINFMNLSTARAADRAREVGIRKVTGAYRSDLVRQFLGESILMSFIGFALSLLLVGLFLPVFNSLSGKQLSIANLFDLTLLPALFGITLFTGLAAGSYPAFFLSSFHPSRVLKGGWMSGGRGQSALRKTLVVVQFTLTVFLVIGTITVDKQLRYIRNKKLGMDTHHVLTIQLPRSRGYLDALLQNPNILAMTQSVPPGFDLRAAVDVSWVGKNPETYTQFFPIRVDAEYLKVYRLGMAEGRFFSAERESDRTDALIINQTAARVMGPDPPVGKQLTFSDMSGHGTIQERTLTVIGVVQDFHQSSLHRTIDPMIFTYDGNMTPWCAVRINSSKVGETIQFLESTYKSFDQYYPFTYSFLDERFDSFYKSDRKIRSILGLFAVLAIFTACLGLSGLASFIAEKKTKEIGIRKVLGASARGLVLMQAKEFIGWILVANVIAWPAAYFAVNKWLEGFAYRVRPGIEPAAIAALFTLVVALLAILYKAIRAAHANPVESLKYE